MSKITFRADDALIDRLEALDASKSEVMRAALREHLDEREGGGSTRREGSRPEEATLDDSLDALIADRIDAHLDRTVERVESGPDVNVSIHLSDGRVREASVEEGNRSAVEEDDRRAADVGPAVESAVPRAGRSRPAGHPVSCIQCGATVDADHRNCTNCGAERPKQVYCECGEDLLAQWQFCPGCGRRTHPIDVFDR